MSDAPTRLKTVRDERRDDIIGILKEALERCEKEAPTGISICINFGTGTWSSCSYEDVYMMLGALEVQKLNVVEGWNRE